MPQPLQEFLGHAKREQNAPKLLARAAASPPPGTYFWGPPWGAAMPSRGGGMKERRLHATRPSHVQWGQKHQLSSVSWRGVMLTYVSCIKGKVRGARGKNETFMTVHI